ncbi:MAG: hypothetical protein EPN48_14075 [Microbacteriaceae bacterium]|nr:MAG: hypothetical protein EPN48_14075 [Microbacteriaceae bacterium]
MTASLLIGLIGLTDIVRNGRGITSRWILMLALWVAFAVLAIAGLSVPSIETVVIVGITLGWVLGMPGVDAAAPRRLWPVPLLVIAVVGFLAFSGTLAPAGGFVVNGYAGLTDGLLRHVPLSTALAVIAVTVFLPTSGNIIVRAALGRTHQPTERIVATPHRAWEIRIRGRAVGEIGERGGADPSVPILKGGRLIGPIERLLIVALALFGAYVLIAALIAAKGVVRFPEISENRGIGTKAEEFLVGSFASWSVSAGAAIYLASFFH